MDRFTQSAASTQVCSSVQDRFSAYLDGAVSGVEMAHLATHLDRCSDCAAEFAAWRAMQSALSDLKQPTMPARLQMQLRQAIASERERGTHLPPAQRVARHWQSKWRPVFAPVALRAAGGFSLAIVVLTALSWLFAAPIVSVEANDDNLAHLIAPRYLYSQVPPQPVLNSNDAPILVDAKVNDKGQVYDYNIVTGSTDPAVVKVVQENLLNSVFQPATLFGTPVRGHVVLTYTGVSVRG